jgi:filamentous hemagglutinin
MLFLNFGSKARAEQYLAQKLNPAQKLGPLPGAQVKSFEVPKSFLDDLRASAVTEKQLNLDPSLAGRPLRVDITKAPDQYGLRPEQIEALKNAIIQGSGKVGLE